MRQKGLSLIELLVAVTILALATTVALVVYDHARLAYKTGENVTEQQQVARLAFDVVSSDLRMAGFNTNPDGNRTRPDEQIEAAYATAITVRADFDAEDPVDADLPEQTLGGAGAAFLAVSTGNDEIVSYVLAKPDGTSSDTLAFSADVGQAVRDASLEDVTIGQIDLAQTDPPYTLYQLVLENDPSGCCGTSFARRIPLVDNVRTMRFRYFDRAGNELTAPGGADTPAAIAARSSIRRVELEIEALTRDSDPHWFDADDANPVTQRFRKFGLTGEVAPPNLGRTALKDLQADATAPGPPASPWLYSGHCEGLYVDWPPNPPQDDVAYYRVEYGTSPTSLNGVRTTPTPGIYLSGLTHGTTYHVAVQAVDASGNRSAPSSQSQTNTTNTTTPVATIDLVATDMGSGQIDLSWTETPENTTSVTGDPASPSIRDLAGYRVYRHTSPGFVPSGSNLLADEIAAPNLPSPLYSDSAVGACTMQYYKVRAVDSCGTQGGESGQVNAMSWSDVDPLAPLDVQAFHGIPGQVQVSWSAVVENVNGDTVYVDSYKLYRSPLQSAALPNPVSWSYLNTINGATDYLDSIVIPPGETVHYLVQAVDQCLPPNESTLSDPANPQCVFSGLVQINEPAYGISAQGDTLIEVAVAGAVPSATNDSVDLTFTREADGATWSTTIGSGGSTWQYLWDASTTAFPVDFFEVGDFLITAEVDQTVASQTCSATATIRVTVVE